MKALSVKQPYATSIVNGIKTVECRTWRTRYRGELLICSSKGDTIMEMPELNGQIIVPGGMALGVVEFVDCRRMTRDDLEPACIPKAWALDVLKGYAWHIKPLYEIVPFPVKGKLGLYNVDAALERLPRKYQNHLVYLDYIKYGKFRFSEWEEYAKSNS